MAFVVLKIIINRKDKIEKIIELIARAFLYLVFDIQTIQAKILQLIRYQPRWEYISIFNKQHIKIRHNYTGLIGRLWSKNITVALIGKIIKTIDIMIKNKDIEEYRVLILSSSIFQILIEI